MMTQPTSEIDQFHKWLEGSYEQIAKDALEKIRAKAWDHFLELGLPTRKNEEFRYVKLRNLYERAFSLPKQVEVTSIDRYLLPECKDSRIVFVNGFFQPKLSHLPGKTVLAPMTEAMKTYGSFLNNQWAKTIKEETDPFAALNAALHREGAFLYLPPKTVLEKPVQVLYLYDPQGSATLFQPRLQLFAGVHSQIALCTTQAFLSEGHSLINTVSDLFLDEEAHVRFIQSTIDEPAESWHFDATRGHLKRNSTLQTVSATKGGTSIRYDYRISLSGENAEAMLNGLWMLNGKDEAHSHVLMDHQAPHCRSLQLFKGVLNDTSHSSFEGKILVRQAAQKTDAFQLNNNLLLSDRATADSKPNLEIFADDVKASHGATVGQLDSEQLFYMQTRGFAEDQAKNFLVQGFCDEIIDKVGLPSLKSAISKHASSFLTKR